MSNETSRKAFEAWCVASNQKYHFTDDGMSNRQDWQTWQASRKALEAEQAQAVEPVKWWPFVETPGHFTARLEKAIATNINLLAAVRNVLIEVPPTLTHPRPSLTEALAAQGIKLRTEFETKPREPYFEGEPDGAIHEAEQAGQQPLSTERGEVIKWLRSQYRDTKRMLPIEQAHHAADMLEADARELKVSSAITQIK